MMMYECARASDACVAAPAQKVSAGAKSRSSASNATAGAVIAIAVLLGVCIILGVIMFFVYRRDQARRQPVMIAQAPAAEACTCARVVHTRLSIDAVYSTPMTALPVSVDQSPRGGIAEDEDSSAHAKLVRVPVRRVSLSVVTSTHTRARAHTGSQRGRERARSGQAETQEEEARTRR
jgi:hypothetical protein